MSCGCTAPGEGRGGTAATGPGVVACGPAGPPYPVSRLVAGGRDAAAPRWPALAPCAHLSAERLQSRPGSSTRPVSVVRGCAEPLDLPAERGDLPIASPPGDALQLCRQGVGIILGALAQSAARATS